MRWGFDTGFFFRLAEGDGTAVAALNSIRHQESSAVVSCVSLFEIERAGLRGRLPSALVQALRSELPHIAEVVWLTNHDALLRAARMAHGVGLSMSDSLILTSLIDQGAEEILTTDADLARYTAGPPITLI